MINDKNNLNTPDFSEKLSDRNFSDDTTVVEKKSNENFSDENSSDEPLVVEKNSIENDFYKNNHFTDKNQSGDMFSTKNENESDSETYYADSSPVTDSSGTNYSTNYYSESNFNNDESENDSEYEVYNQPYFVENNKDNKNVKKVTKFSKTVVAAIVCIALVGGIAVGTLFGAPVMDRLGDWPYSQKDPDADTGNVQSPETENSSGNASGFLTYAIEDADASSLSTAEIAAKCLPSVVEIRTETVTTGSFFQDFVTEGAGSGVIITEDGYIVTNYHVIAETNTIYVTLNTGDEYEADLIGADEKSDLAVIKIDKTGLTPATIGDSDKLVVGEKAVAIGNPLGELGGTVTDGIISALDREMTIEGQQMTLLQTNAAINPGNSGGGLFNGLGNLIAIVDAKSSGTGIEGLGFAIPSNKMSEVVNQIIEYGYVKGYVDTGMTFIDINDYYTAMQYRVNEFGVYVLKVYGDYALEAGFQSGDLILQVNGTEVKTTSDLESIIEEMSVGDTVEFKIYRTRSTLSLSLTLEEYVPES